ncbi:hypothetical protein M2T28_14500 [Elizabethkingia miricola]|uniref:hypothetical protein n=1 Tax=Elizabethkingia TaxID=308865 RepID=UPI00061C8BA3|nr:MULTISPECIES: hypothetical protein [Elizabethkingia]MCL1653830.1 hypothetical protein [Elizabethkingia miricola]QCO45806.1 hypothetical protein FCS00_05260 [Elizabethkingia sp. 2-6]WQM37654.1 hypothetical protein U2S95_14940 [Elizabethkingia miricola]CRH24913.1 Uncharacterised protein [Chlamydia trachomatis]
MKTNKYTYLKVIQQNLSGKWKDIEEVEANSIYIPKCGESIFKTLLSGYKLLGVSTKTINRRVINEKTSLRQNFKDCDDFANYVLDSVLDYGEIISNEFNQLTGLNIKVGSDINTIESLPCLGINYIELGSVKSMLYDLYYFLIKENKINTLN